MDTDGSVSDLNADPAGVAEANSVSRTCDQAIVQPGNSAATSVTDEAIDQALHEILNLATDFCRPQVGKDFRFFCYLDASVIKLTVNPIMDRIS